MSLSDQLLGVLFYMGEPVSYAELARITESTEEDVQAGITDLRERFARAGLRVITVNATAQLVTAPELDTTIEMLRKEGVSRDIGKAGAETLAIILYHGTVSRPRIDAIRGVQSGAILRSLLVRGLIERVQDAENPRATAYRATSALIGHLGVTDRSELTDFHEVMAALESFDGAGGAASEQGNTNA